MRRLQKPSGLNADMFIFHDLNGYNKAVQTKAV